LDRRIFIVEVAKAGDEALVLHGNSGEFEEAILDGTRVDDRRGE